MKKVKQDQRTRNYDGIYAMEPEGYAGFKESARTFHLCGRSWMDRSVFVIAASIVLAAMDGVVLWSVMDKAMVEDWRIGLALSIGLSFVLNALPMIAAYCCYDAIYRTGRMPRILCGICIFAFLVLYTGTVILRLAFKDMYTGFEAAKLVNLAGDQGVQETADTFKQNAIILLLSVEPLATSLTAFVLTFISEKRLQKQIEHKELRLHELDEAIAELEAAQATMDADLEEELDMDEELMNTVILDIRARADVLKSTARLYLTEYLSDPASITRLSHELDPMLHRDTREDRGDSPVITAFRMPKEG